MAGFTENNDDIISGINVTPLVDIMLVLLIIFMLVSSFTQESAIDVDLPHAATGKEVESTSLSVVISKEGEYYLGGKKLDSFEAMQAEIRSAKEKNPEIQVIISADRKVYHEKVIGVIDMIRKLDIYKFAINVEYEAEES